jgi:hypothetical protein
MTSPDQEFERALLASARADGPSTEARGELTERAWARFSARMAAVGGVGLGERRAGREALRGASRGAAVRWVLLGAIGGSALTAALVGTWSWKGTPAPRPIAGVASPVTEGGAPVPATVKPVEPAAGRSEERRSPAAASGHAVRRIVRADLGSEGQPAASLVSPSTLAAEVAALDAARAATAGGAFDQALRLIGRYHYDFPLGELAADADVVAIEALDAKNDRAEMARQAARFLERYPDDPHAARIRRLLIAR